MVKISNLIRESEYRDSIQRAQGEQEEARRRVRCAVRARAGTSVALHQSLAQTHRAQSDEGRQGTHYSVEIAARTESARPISNHQAGGWPSPASPMRRRERVSDSSRSIRSMGGGMGGIEDGRCSLKSLDGSSAFSSLKL